MAEQLKTVVDRLLSGLLGDAEHVEKPRPQLMVDMLSDWLPYRVYDPATRLYFNARSKGFVLSVTPLIGADERTGEILGQFFSEGLPAGACLQVLHLASPRISRIIAPWFAPRYMQGGVYEAIARHRARRLYSAAARWAPARSRARRCCSPRLAFSSVASMMSRSTLRGWGRGCGGGRTGCPPRWRR